MAVLSAASGSPNNLEFFYSAPSSPAAAPVDDFSTPGRFDDFEFETSKKFDEENIFECFLEVGDRKEVVDYYYKTNKIRERSGSLPTMAFADELFANGLVVPLKLKPPPRLQSQTISSTGNLQQYCSVPSSPTSSVFKNPFVRRVAWNDDFDPFIVALQKVTSEENRGRSSNSSSHHHHHHRRTRSHSPFRTNQYSSEHNHRCNSFGKWNQFEDEYMETIKISPGRSYSNLSNIPQEPQLKGSPYARWVLDQTNQAQKISPKGKNMFKSFTFVKSRVRPVKTDKTTAAEENIGQKKEQQNNGDSKMKRIKGILQKYGSFRKENNEDKSRKQNSTRRTGLSYSYSYLKKFSFKMRGNGSDENGRKKRAAIMAEPKMAVVEYKRNKPTLALCFYGIESPGKQNQPIIIRK